MLPEVVPAFLLCYAGCSHLRELHPLPHLCAPCACLRVVFGPWSSGKVSSQLFWLFPALGTALAFPLADPVPHIQAARGNQLHTREDAEIPSAYIPPLYNCFGNSISLCAFEGSLSFLVGLGELGLHPCPCRCDLTHLYWNGANFTFLGCAQFPRDIRVAASGSHHSQYLPHHSFYVNS